MPSIPEGHFTYQFPDGWSAHKYDQDGFYIRHFQRVGQIESGDEGAKAVDVLAFGAGQELWLIEQKDYTGGQAQIQATALLRAFSAKVTDTLACLLAARSNAQPGSTSHELATQALTKPTLRCVLHVEQPVKPSKLFPQVIDPKTARDKLRRSIKPIDPRAEFGSAAELNAKALGWSIL
jgi:hypothetical protein